MEPKDITPVELRDGMYYKREDFLARPTPVKVLQASVLVPTDLEVE